MLSARLGYAARVGAALLALCWIGCGAPDGPHESPGSPPSSRYSLEPARVPDELRHLVPLAAEWGIGDDIERMERVETATAAEREALAAAVSPYQSRITAWLDSFGTDEMSDEAAAFMYLQLALEEMP